MRPFLVVGTQRTGSSALAEQLGLRRGVVCGWESTNRTPPWRKLVVAEQILAGDFRNVRPRERAHLEASHGPDTRAIGFRRLFRASARWLGHPALAPALWVDALEAHVAWLRAHPEVHVVHVTRTDNVAWLRSIGLARASGSYVGTAYPDDAETRWPLQQAYRRVLAKHWIGRRLGTLEHSNPYAHVTYEGFREDNEAMVARLAQFLGLEPAVAPGREPRIRSQSKGPGASFVNAEEVAGFLERRGLRHDSPVT